MEFSGNHECHCSPLRATEFENWPIRAIGLATPHQVAEAAVILSPAEWLIRPSWTRIHQGGPVPTITARDTAARIKAGILAFAVAAADRGHQIVFPLHVHRAVLLRRFSWA